MRSRMRKAALVLLIVATLAASGCSASTALVVINLSDKPVDVRYRLRYYPGDVEFSRAPKIKTQSELNDDVPWHELAAGQYVADKQSQTMRITLAPGTAVLLARVSGVGVSKRPEDADHFPITEIVMRGANGVTMLQGDQVRQSFAEETKQTYSITYR